METKDKFFKLITLMEDLGESAARYFYQDDDFAEKDDKSVVTKIDIETEEGLRKFVTTYFPDDTIVGEEGEDKNGSSGFVWYLDPIDGTENFVRKIPLFSITATRLGPTAEGSLAVVHNPISKQTFSAFLEDGVFENNNLVKTTKRRVGGRIAVNILSSKVEPWIQPAKYNLVRDLGLKYGKSGSFSAGLLEFAYVAAGRLDGVVSLNNNPWDTAAGLYLNKAAGNPISIFAEGVWQPYKGAIKDLYGKTLRERSLLLVSRADLHKELCDLVGDPKRWADKY